MRARWSETLIDLVAGLNLFHISGEKKSWREYFTCPRMGGAVEEKNTDAHDTALITDLRNLLTMLREGGGKPSWDAAPDTPFYILGLAPNAARISVRFWHASTVEGIIRMLAEHYQDLELEPRYENEPKYPGIFRLLLETVPARKKADGRIERKADDIQPLLGGELVRAILTGAEFPRHMDLDGQAMFTLGYYHQRNALWRKKVDDSSNSPEA